MDALDGHSGDATLACQLRRPIRTGNDFLRRGVGHLLICAPEALRQVLGDGKIVLHPQGRARGGAGNEPEHTKAPEPFGCRGFWVGTDGSDSKVGCAGRI